MTIVSIPDLIITIAYFSIPLQILWSLLRYPRITRRATKRVVLLLILFALFIFCCGAGHLLRCLQYQESRLFVVVNALTAVVSFVTAVYLLPFVPHLLDGADRMYLEVTTSKHIIESMYPPTVRERLLKRDGVKDVGGSGSTKSDDGSDENVDVQLQHSLPQHESRGKMITRILSRSDSLALKRIQQFARRRWSQKEIEMSERDNNTNNEPIADDFHETSIMFADISNFTYWSSRHTPSQVFGLLESIFFEFDKIADEMEVFKLSTVGDCYIACTGVPFPRDDHAAVLAQFARRCLKRGKEVLEDLGHEDLNIRIGVHSGPCVAGILRGNKGRFDVFGDTINTAARIEGTGVPGRIHVSREMAARLLKDADGGDCLIPRDGRVSAKGKGELETYWLKTLDRDEDGDLC